MRVLSAAKKVSCHLGIGAQIGSHCIPITEGLDAEASVLQGLANCYDFGQLRHGVDCCHCRLAVSASDEEVFHRFVGGVKGWASSSLLAKMSSSSICP